MTTSFSVSAISRATWNKVGACRIVGSRSSGAWGYRVEKSIALGMIRSDLAQPGTEIEVEIYGQRVSATVQPDQPLWDPSNERLRA